MNEPSRRKRKPRTAGSSIKDLGISGLDGNTRNSVGKVDESVPFGVDESEDTLSDTAPEVPVSVVDLSTLTFDDEDEVVYIGTKEGSADNSRTDGTMFSSSLICDSQADLDSSHSSFRITNSSNTNVYIKQEPISDESDFDERDVFSEQHEVDELSSSSGLVQKLWEQCSIAPSEKRDLLDLSATVTNKSCADISGISATITSKSCADQHLHQKNPFCLKPCYVKCEKLDISKFNLKNRKAAGSVKVQLSVRGKPSKQNSVCPGVRKNQKVPQISKVTSPISSFPRVVFQSPQQLNVISSHESSLKKMSFVKILPSVQTHSQLQTEKLLLPNASVQRPAYVIRSLPDLKLSLLVPVQQCVSNVGVQPATSEKPVYLSSNLGQSNMTNRAVFVNHSTQISENSTRKTASENPMYHDLFSAKENQKILGATNRNDVSQGDYRENSAIASLPEEEEFRNNSKQTTISQYKNSRTGAVEAKDLPSCNVRLIKIDKHVCEEQKQDTKNAAPGLAKQEPSDVAKQSLPNFNVSSEEIVSDNSYDSRDFMINKMVNEETDAPESSPVIVKKVQLSKDLISKRLTVDLQTDQSLDVLWKDDKAPVHDTSFVLAESRNESVSHHNVHDNSESATLNTDASHLENCAKKEIHNLEDCASEKEAIDFLSNLSPSEFLKVCSAVMSNSIGTNLSNVDFTKHSEKKELVNLAECTSEKDAIDCLSKLSPDEFLRICSGATEVIGDGMECEEHIVNSENSGHLGSNEEHEGISNISKSEDKGDESDQLQGDTTVVEEELDSFSDHNEDSVSELSEEESQDIEEGMSSSLQPDRQISDETKESDVQIKTVFEKEMWDVLFNNADASYESDEIDVCSFSAEEGDSNIKDCHNNSKSSTCKRGGKTNLKTCTSDREEKTVTTRSKSRRGNSCISSDVVPEQEVKSPEKSFKSESTACISASKENPVSEKDCQSNVTIDSSIVNKSDVEVSLPSPLKISQRSHWTRRSRRKQKKCSLVKEEDHCKASEQKHVRDKVLSISGETTEHYETSKASSERSLVEENSQVISDCSEENTGKNNLVDDVAIPVGNDKRSDASSSELRCKNKVAEDLCVNESESEDKIAYSAHKEVTNDNMVLGGDATNLVEMCQKKLYLNDSPVTKSENEEVILLPSQHGQGEGEKDNLCEKDEVVQKTVVSETGMEQELSGVDICNYSDANTEIRNVKKMQVEQNDTKPCDSVSCIQKDKICDNDHLGTGESSSSNSEITDVLKPSIQGGICHSSVTSPTCEKEGETETCLVSEICESTDDIKQKDLQTENRLIAGKSIIHEVYKTTDDHDVERLENVNTSDSLDRADFQVSSAAGDILTGTGNISFGSEGIQEHDFSGEEQDATSSEFVEVPQIKERVSSSPCKTSRRRKSPRGGYRKRKRRKSSSRKQQDTEASAVSETFSDSAFCTEKESASRGNLMSDHEIESPLNVGISKHGSNREQYNKEMTYPSTSKESDSEGEKTGGKCRRSCGFSDEAEERINSDEAEERINSDEAEERINSDEAEERINSDEAEERINETKRDSTVHNILTVDKTPIMRIKSDEQMNKSTVTRGDECVTSGSVNENLYSSSPSSNDTMSDEDINNGHTASVKGSDEKTAQEDTTTEHSNVINSKMEHKDAGHYRNSQSGRRRGRRRKSQIDNTDEIISTVNTIMDEKGSPKQEDAEHEICSSSGVALEKSENVKEYLATVTVVSEHARGSYSSSLEDSEGVNDGIICQEQVEHPSSASLSDEKEGSILKNSMMVDKTVIEEQQEGSSKEKSVSSPLREHCYGPRKRSKRRRQHGFTHTTVEHQNTAKNETSTAQKDSKEIRKSFEETGNGDVEDVEDLLVEGMTDSLIADKCMSSRVNEQVSVMNKSEINEPNLFVTAQACQDELQEEMKTHEAFEEGSDSPKVACCNDTKVAVQNVDGVKQCRGRGRPCKDSKIPQERKREKTPENVEVLQKIRRRGRPRKCLRRLQKNAAGGKSLENFKKLIGKNMTRNISVNGAVVLSTRWALRNRNKSGGVFERCLRNQKTYRVSAEVTDIQASEAEDIKLTKKQRVKNNETCYSSGTSVQKNENSAEMQQLTENMCTDVETNSAASTDISDRQSNCVNKVDNDQLKTPSAVNKTGVVVVKDSEGQEIIIVDDDNEFSSMKHQEINDSVDSSQESSESTSHSECDNYSKPKDVCQMSGKKIVSPLKLIKEKAKEGIKSGAEPAYRVELSPEEATANCVDQKSISVRSSRKRCKTRNRGKQLNMELTPASEKPPLCLSSDNEKHAEADVSLPSETDESSEIMVDDTLNTEIKETEESVNEENMPETSQESPAVSMETSSSSPKHESKENISKDPLPEGGQKMGESAATESAKRNKRKRSIADDKFASTGNETFEAALNASADSSKSKRRRSNSEDKVPTKEISSESALPSPSLSATPKTDGEAASELNSKESVTAKGETSESVRYSSSGRKICRKSFSDELYITPDLVPKSSASKEEKKPVQLSSSGRKVSKKTFGDDVHTPPIAGISPATPKTIKSERKRADGDFIKPFTMGWMREVVYRATNDSPQVGKRKSDIYYFSPEGTKLRSMPEIGTYLSKNKVTNLDLSNFTFVKETIYREPFEKEREAKFKVGSSTTNSSAAKPKKEVTTDSKPGSATVEKRVPKVKLPFTFPSPAKNSSKTPNTKEEKTKELKKPANKQNVSNQNITPKRKKTELAGEKRKLDLNPLLVSTKKLLQPQNWESDTVRRCSKQCPDSNSEDPSLQCKKCLCLFHPRCVSIKLKKNQKYDFVCKLCSTDIEGSNQSSRQEISDSNHVTEKVTNANSCEVSEINLVPEVVLEQNPHDPPIKQLDWKNKTQPSMAPLTRPYGGPPPLKRAPDASLKNKVGSAHALQNTPGLETSNNVPRNNPALCSALASGAKLPPLLPGSFILRSRLTQNKHPSAPVAQSVNVSNDSSLANTPAGVPYYQFTGTSQAAGSTVSSPAVSASTTAMPPPGKNVKAPRFILPAPTVSTPTSSTLLQGQASNTVIQQVKVTPYSNTIIMSQSSSYALNSNNTVVTYTKVDSVSPGMNAVEKSSRQPLKMCDFNIVPANGSNQVSPPGVVTYSPLNDVAAQSSESVNVVNSHISRPSPQKSEKPRNSSPVSSQKTVADVCTPTKNTKCELTPPKFSNALESSEASLQGGHCSSKEEFSPLRNSLEDRKPSEGDQKLWTDHVGAKDEDDGNSSNSAKPSHFSSSLSKGSTVMSPVYGINKLMWGFDALNLIFEKLPVNDLLRASQVCRSWRNLASQHFLWRNISLRDLKIRNWKRCANALRRYRTSSLDLRGLQHISDSDNTWNEFIGIIKFLKHLEKIVFGQVPPSVIIALSEFLTQLRSLECYCLTEVCEEPDLWNSSCDFDFSCIKNLRQLERLRIRSANELKVSSEVLASALCDLPALQHLSLTSFTNLRGSDFGFLRNLKNLLSLELGDTKNWECENFTVLAELPNLQALRLDNGGSVSDTGLAEAIMKMKDLQELRLINYKIPSNLGSALKKARSLRRLSIWPDNSSEAALVNFNALEAVSKVKKLTYFCWGILIADGNQDLTDGCRPLVDVLKPASNDAKVAEDVLHLGSVDLLERLYYLLPNVEVQVECIHRSKFNKYWTVHK